MCERSKMDKKVILKPKQSLSQVNLKRKTWKSDSIGENSIQIVKEKSDLTKNVDEMLKKGPIQIRKTRSDACKEMNVQTMKAKFDSQKQIQLRKAKSDANKVMNDGGVERNLTLRKAKSESKKAVDDDTPDGNVAKNSLQLVRVKSVSSSKVFDENRKNCDDSEKNLGMVCEDIKKIPVEIKGKISDECEEKIITSDFSNVGRVKSGSIVEFSGDNAYGVDDPDDDDDDDDLSGDDEDEDEVEVEIEKKSLVVFKEISIEEQRRNTNVIEEKKHQHKLPVSSSTVKKQPPSVVNNVKVHPSPSKTKSTPVTEEFQTVPERHSKLQSLVDLVMWKDISKSALIFGIGTFIIISSTYTQDIKISVISVLSHLGLFYLAATFLFRSLIFRGAADTCNTGKDYVVREEEVVWVMKRIVPYVNEFLLNIKALFSGDPATTMKMAVLLFVLARCGSSITILKMAKLGFLGVFIVPKVCSSYSPQITAFGTFWIQRFRDAWGSCSHKKALAFGVLAMVWNLSSIFARIWTMFMLFVAFKYYQQRMIREGWRSSEEAKDEEYSWQGQVEKQRKDRRSVIMDTTKRKKAF